MFIMALIPSMEPHSLRNNGDEPLHMIGIFSSNTVMSTFEHPLLPLGQPPVSPFGERTILAPLPVQLEQPSAISVAA